MCKELLDAIPKETINQAYNDGLQPVVKETGKMVGRIPRAINAALASLDQWILQKEYNVAETQRALEKKLQAVNPEDIVSPEPYVAVPALQSISYCLSNEELHNLYANLLAKAMIKNTKNEVHPAFVEIIKQMSPNDAIVLKDILAKDGIVAKVNFSIVIKRTGLHLVGQSSETEGKQFTESIYNISCDTLSEEQISISVDNLHRLGIIDFFDIKLSDSSLYNFATESKLYREVHDLYEKMKTTNEYPDYIDTQKTCATLTLFGNAFGKICILDIESNESTS